MKALFLAAAGLLAHAGPGLACGTCAEDKMAATYDYAVVQGASRAGRVMVFLDVRGPFQPEALAAAARRVRGVDPRSVRVSREPAAISFALDTRQQAVATAVRLLERSVNGVHLVLVRAK